MKNGKQHNTRLLPWVRRLLLGLGLGMSVHVSDAQEERPVPKSYLNKGTVHLPIQIDDRVRPLLQEVQLYVKDNPQAPWNLKEKVPGTQPFFTFRTPHDGEYWFNVVTVDRNGKAIPANVSKEPPGLIVVIDSTPPQLEVRALPATPEGQTIRCEIRDANPDPAKTRLFFQTRDQIWRSVDAANGQPDTFCIPAQAATTGMIRVTACDMAKNTVTREFNLASLPTAKSASTPTPRSLSNVVVIDNPAGKTAAPAPLPDMATIPNIPEPVVISEKIVPYSERIEIMPNRPSSPTALSQGPSLEQAAKAPFAVPSVPEIRHVAQTSTCAKQTESPAKRHLVNNAHIFLDYQIEQAGVSGVGRIEIWCTRDMGQTWQKLGEDVNRKGQAEVDLPGEGVYGVTLVVANGRGFGANPPKAGDSPDWWIEVDTTKPQVNILDVRSNPTGDDGSLHITWTATDKNLHSEPIDLYYAVDRQGPWLPIAKGLKNDGLYRWLPTAVIGKDAYIRLTAHDQAGNSASCESVQPVALDDLSRPRGRVVGVTTIPRTVLGSGPGPLPPTGN